MVMIPGIYVEIKGDSTQLKKDITQARQIVTEQAKGMSDSLNNALSGAQAKKGINSLITDLGTLSRSSALTGNAFKGLGVNLGDLQKVTGTTVGQFQKLQEQILKTQASTQQEKALRSIAQAAGLTGKEIEALGKQFNLSNEQIKRVVASQNELGKATTNNLSRFKDMIVTIGVYTVAFGTLSAVMRGIQGEFVAGLKAVEDFGMTIAKNTALITNFSEKAKQGDIAGAYIDANKYAKELALSMEMIDQKTIANSQHLQAMSETFIQNGVLLDINNKKQVEGFTTIANALSILTQGQNQDLQMRQEIRGLMDGEIRAADKLGSLLKAQIPDLEKQLLKWREQGTTIEEIGKLLQGFNAATGLLEDQWATVGSTMETIHNKVLRGMFEPVFKDLIKLAKEFNQSLMDAEGNLTPLARGLIKAVNEAYELMKGMGSTGNKLFDPISLSIRGTGLAVDFLKEKIEDLGSTPLEQAKSDLAEINQKMQDFSTRGDDWWEFSFFKDKNADKQYLSELTAQAEQLRGVIRDIQNEETREKQRFTGGGVIAPAIAAPPARANSQARDLNAAMQARAELVKAEEEKRLEIIRTSIEQEQFVNQQNYDLGLSSYSDYLRAKNQLAEESLAAQVEAREKELAAARDAASKLSPITDKDGNYEPDKDAKAHADALRRVEDAERAVIAARADLTKAVQEGSLEEQKAARDSVTAYKEIEIQLLEMQGKDVEAARMRADIDANSLDRLRLELDAIAGISGAKEALAAEEKKNALVIERLEIDRLGRQKEAKLAIAELTGENNEALDIQIELLDIEIQRAELAGELPEQIKYLRLQREELEAMKDPIKAIALGFRDVAKEQKLVGELMRELARDTAKDIRGTFQDTLVAGMKGDFDSIGEMWGNLMDRMLDRFLGLIAELAANSVMEAMGLGKLTGGGPTLGSLFSGGSSGGGDSIIGTIGSAIGSIFTDSSFMETGDDFSWFADGGVIQGGTGRKDDVYLGKVGGKGIMAKGGEYIMPPDATAKYFPILEAMREGGPDMGFAAGGSTSGRRATGRPGGNIASALASLSRGSAMTAQSLGLLSRNVVYLGDVSNGVKESTAGAVAASNAAVAASNEATEASKKETAAKKESTAKSFDLTDSVVDFGFAIGGTIAKTTAAALGLGMLGPMAVDAGAKVTGLSETLEGFKQSVKDVVNEVQSAIGELFSSAAEYASSIGGGDIGYNEAGFSTYGGDLVGESTDPGSYGDSGGGWGGNDFGGGPGDYGSDDDNSGSFYADGGIHRGGWRVVGERGPELEYTPPSRIFSNADSKNMISGLKSTPQQITIPISIGNEALTTLVVSIADKHISVRERQGVTGRAYAR